MPKRKPTYLPTKHLCKLLFFFFLLLREGSTVFLKTNSCNNCNNNPHQLMPAFWPVPQGRRYGGSAGWDCVGTVGDPCAGVGGFSEGPEKPCLVLRDTASHLSSYRINK